MLTTCRPSPRSLCLVVPGHLGSLPACVSRGPSFQSLGVLSLSFSGAGGPSLSRASICPPLVPPQFLLVTLGHAPSPPRRWEKTGCDRQEVFLSDWTALPNSPVGEMGTRMGTGSDPLTDVFCCHAVRLPPKAFQGIWSPKRRLPVGDQLSSPLSGHTAEAGAGPHLQAYGNQGRR